MTRVTSSLSGEWMYRYADADWAAIDVPGCWEVASGIKDFSGPVWYRTELRLPALAPGIKSWLEFDGVSYACELFLDGELIGAHIGIWDRFRVALPDSAANKTTELLLRIEKPASLIAGPDSGCVSGNYPLRSTLAGFLPYVWGHMFGGIWQDVRLVCAGPGVIEDLRVQGSADGHVTLQLSCDQTTELDIEIIDSDGQLLLVQHVKASDMRPASQLARMASQSPGTYTIQYELEIPNPRCWKPDRPELYTLCVRSMGDSYQQRFGLRDLCAQGTDIVLNGQAIYPRMALSWGWYADVLHSNPGPERIRAEFRMLKALGYNGVKLCLWVPPAEYFELADEMGMLLWLELPMWLPKPNRHFHEQLMPEYTAIVRQTCDHPSLIMYSLGCELNKLIGPELLEPLYSMTRALAGNVLVRDNSGSGEAYGGLLHEFADYYDYHFYSDLQHFRHLLDHFAPRWRPVQPWVFGEFCDLDTFRGRGQMRAGEAADQGSLVATQDFVSMDHINNRNGELPWWFSDDPLRNPQGARWQFDLPFHEQRMRKNGLWERADELEQLSYQHGLLHRKWTIEAVRCYREIGGYVITGEVDTPISTAGMWDEQGRLKFDADSFRAFNADTVLCVGWDKRRAWVHGGDRAAYWDNWSYCSGAVVRAHLILSHYGEPGPVHVRWSVECVDSTAFSTGEQHTSFSIESAELREVALAEFTVPKLRRPQRAILRAEWTIGTQHGQNSWELYFFPDKSWSKIAPLVYDPLGVLKGLEQIAPTAIAYEGRGSGQWGGTQSIHKIPLLTSLWTADVEAFVRAGGRAILLQQADGPPGPLAVAHMPFWREALRVVEPHPAWGDFPHVGWADLALYGCATDATLKTGDWEGRQRSILRRVDVRTMELHDYAVELYYGAGRLIVSTLRFQGGHGDQPLGIAHNTAAAYLLGCWVKYLGNDE